MKANVLTEITWCDALRAVEYIANTNLESSPPRFSLLDAERLEHVARNIREVICERRTIRDGCS
jgi:hypothetical protein